ncbi:GTP-binding protein [Dapis sp. BLCC M229]
MTVHKENRLIMTGFLVSDKTNLLNFILQNKQDLRVAVFVNEFSNQ